jgi:hypothetical protein
MRRFAMTDRPAPRLRFYEETLRTPEEARIDEMKALLADPDYREGERIELGEDE